MLAVIPLLALLSLTHSPVASPSQETFEEIASQADKAREGDRLTDAIALYSEGVRLHPSWVDGWWWLSSLLYEQDRFSEAQAPLKRFIAIAPKPAPAYAFLALCEYETHDYDAALRHFQEWGRRGSPGNDALIDVAGFHWALLLTRNGRFVQALYLLAAKAHKLGPSPELIEALGLASLRMPYLPEDYPPERRELVWLAGKAAGFLSTNSVSQADEYARAMQLHYDKEPYVHFFRGTLFSFQKDWASAADEYQRELQLWPKCGPALVELAFARIETFQPAEALSPAERAVVLLPEDARARYVLGRALLDLERFRESVEQLEAAKRLAPNSARIRFSLATAYERSGRIADARRERVVFQTLKKKEDAAAAHPHEETASPQQMEHP